MPPEERSCFEVTAELPEVPRKMMRAIRYFWQGNGLIKIIMV